MTIPRGVLRGLLGMKGFICSEIIEKSMKNNRIIERCKLKRKPSDV